MEQEEWKSQPPEVLQHWIDSLKIEHESLSEWENNFILSVEAHLTRSGTLSQKQQLILERIYSEKT